MYLAELHGKLSRWNENKEDILTSNVFSFFKYADRDLFLFPLLKKLELDIEAEDAKTAEFQFWPTYEDGTEPDLIILAGKYYLLIESKYHSGFGQARDLIDPQLIREWSKGRLEAHNLDKIFKLIVVTSHYYYSRELKREVPPEIEDDFLWVNWQAIAFLLYQILESNPATLPETLTFAQDLYHLLVRKNLRNFEGVGTLSRIPQIEPVAERIFFDANTASYRGAFVGFEKPLSSGEMVYKVRTPTNSLFFRSRHEQKGSGR